VIQVKKIVVYSKKDCHLCERAISELEQLRSVENFDLTTRDITEDAEIYERYKSIIPVISVDGVVKLAGTAVSNPLTLRDVLKKAIFSP